MTSGGACRPTAHLVGLGIAGLLIASCAVTVAPSGPATTFGAGSPGATSSVALPSGALPASDVVWKSVSWRKLQPADPLRGMAQVVRGSHALVAVGAPVATATGSHNPLWWSADGTEWELLGPTALGADSIVVGGFAVGDLFVALTMVGGDDACQDPVTPCWDTRPPLRAWTSVDGRSWSLQSEPVNLHLAPGETTLRPPLIGGNKGGVLVVHADGEERQLGWTSDGQTWTSLPREGLPAGFTPLSIGTAGGGFVLTGEGADGLAAVAWSGDGSSWQEVSAFGSHASEAYSAFVLAVGSGGILVEGTNDATPGPIWWWSSPDGKSWQTHDDLAPLGVWIGEGAGSGLLPNGELVGDGERMVAYDTVSGRRAWTSFNGADWTELAITGDAPRAGGPTRDLTLLPIGLLWRDTLGNAWFGEPTTD